MVSAVTGGVFNLSHPMGLLGRISHRAGGPWFAFSNFATPPYEHETQIVGSETCTESRFCFDVRRAIVLLCHDGGTVVERVSYDDGHSFSSEVNRFTSAAHPDLSMSREGLILRAAYRSGALSITRQYPGDSSPGAAFNAKDASSVDLVLTDSSFRLVADHRGLWQLHCRLGAGASTSLLFSSDDGATWAVTSGAVTGITSGSHPGLTIAPSGDLFAYARVGTAVHVSRRHPGSVDWTAPAAMDDDAAVDLSVTDNPLCFAGAYEGSARLVFAGIVTGEAVPSDWGSADFGESAARFAP